MRLASECMRAKGYAEVPVNYVAVDRRRVADCLQHDAIALGEFDQLLPLLLRRVGVEIEAQPDRAKAHRRILRHAERAAEVEVAFGSDGGISSTESQAQSRLP